jgi:hypothetical protein
MKDGGWRMKDGGWRMKEENGFKVEGLQFSKPLSCRKHEALFPFTINLNNFQFILKKEPTKGGYLRREHT